jgi:hypothetical protein
VKVQTPPFPTSRSGALGVPPSLPRRSLGFAPVFGAGFKRISRGRAGIAGAFGQRGARREPGLSNQTSADRFGNRLGAVYCAELGARGAHMFIGAMFRDVHDLADLPVVLAFGRPLEGLALAR